MYYYLFKTQCMRCGAAYFGIHGNNDPFFGDNPLPTLGNGPKLVEHFAIHGKNNHRTTLVFTNTDYNVTENRLKAILAPDVLEHPLCLNANPKEFSEKMREINLNVPKTESHKTSIAIAGLGNTNPLGNVRSPESNQKTSETIRAMKMKWIHNKSTCEEMQMPADEIKECGMPTGFELGRLTKEMRKSFKQDTRPLIKRDY